MKHIRIATIGSSKIAESFLKGARHDERFVHEAVYSRTAERGREFAQKHGVAKVYTSLEDLAADRGIDAVYIASPNICHAPQAIFLMDRGKSVLVEKPAAPTPEEVKAMIETSRRNGVAFMEATGACMASCRGQTMAKRRHLRSVEGPPRSSLPRFAGLRPVAANAGRYCPPRRFCR